MQLEFKLQDYRLGLRAQQCLNKILKKPQESFPNIFNRYSELEGFYRLINNTRVTHTDLLNPCLQKSILSAQDCDEVLAIHDTTVVKPKCNSSSIKGLGETAKSQKGFLLHLSLLVDSKKSPIVHGVAGASFWNRRPEIQLNEYSRWLGQVVELEDYFSDKQVIHVMDREADSYEILYQLCGLGSRFVIRKSIDRPIFNQDKGLKISSELEASPVIGKRFLTLSKRKEKIFKKDRASHPARTSRSVEAEIRTKSVKVQMPKRIRESSARKEFSEFLTVNVVHVKEVNPPDKEKPIEWYLLTNEPINNLKDALKVIDIYRRRWVIEEYFKALKSGCQIERRLFSNLESWYKMIALYLPVATMLLNLRYIDDDCANSRQTFSSVHIEILCFIGLSYGRQLKTMSDFKMELAIMGGYIKSHSPPGWMTLSRGLNILLNMEAGWYMKSIGNGAILKIV